MNAQGSLPHDFSSISPSARALLILKGNTSIPYMLQAAELISAPGKYMAGYEDKTLMECLRIMHLEARYLSIDQLLNDAPQRQILELSSGFSFRGLHMVQQNNIHYIDTDLPDIITEKRKLLDKLQHGQQAPGGKLELLPLNAMDEQQFDDVVNNFDNGPLAIVNEGLLMYLNTSEKEQLCATIHKTLKRKGGYWITTDIYLKTPDFKKVVNPDDELQQFLDQHNIEENKFDSFEAAETFFRKCGFIIDKEAEIDYTKLTALPYMMQKADPEQIKGMRSGGKINATWRLKAL